MDRHMLGKRDHGMKRKATLPKSDSTLLLYHGYQRVTFSSLVIFLVLTKMGLYEK